MNSYIRIMYAYMRGIGLMGAIIVIGCTSEHSEVFAKPVPAGNRGDYRAKTATITIRDLAARGNKWGCDDLRGIELVNSCGGKGACCDIHDECYEKHGCTQKSWIPFQGSEECKKCNSDVVSCILHDNPGPSACCSMKNCGEPR